MASAMPSKSAIQAASAAARHCPSRLRRLPPLVEHAEELRDQLFIPESASRLVAHGHRRLLVAERWFIRTRRAQRIVNVHHLQNARQKRYLGRPKPIRIAAAVRVLVMMPDDRKHQPQRLQRTANRLASRRMPLHNRPLRRRQIAAFLQDFIRHRDLSQVVQVAAPLQSHNALFITPRKRPRSAASRANRSQWPSV